jgi:hypothetical protein
MKSTTLFFFTHLSIISCAFSLVISEDVVPLLSYLSLKLNFRWLLAPSLEKARLDRLKRTDSIFTDVYIISITTLNSQERGFNFKEKTFVGVFSGLRMKFVNMKILRSISGRGLVGLVALMGEMDLVLLPGSEVGKSNLRFDGRLDDLRLLHDTNNTAE